MRPIAKSDSPYKSISEYSKALPYLRKDLGEYCSYCELKLDNAPEVEHVFSKSEGGSKTKWENLLLACKQCNTRKGNTTSSINIDDFSWPDEMNTAIAFSYDKGVPIVNKTVLDTLDPTGEATQKARNLYDLISLGAEASIKDPRFSKRIEAFEKAKEYLNDWKEVISFVSSEDFPTYTERIKEYGLHRVESLKKSIVDLVKIGGFFSVWMEVFKEETIITSALISALPGTNHECFENGKPKETLCYKHINRT